MGGPWWSDVGSGCSAFGAGKSIAAGSGRVQSRHRKRLGVVGQSSDANVRQMRPDDCGDQWRPGQIGGSDPGASPSLAAESPLGMESLGARCRNNDEQFWVWVKSGGVMAIGPDVRQSCEYQSGGGHHALGRGTGHRALGNPLIRGPTKAHSRTSGRAIGDPSLGTTARGTMARRWCLIRRAC